MFKKWLVLLCAVLMLGLTACKNQNDILLGNQDDLLLDHICIIEQNSLNAISIGYPFDLYISGNIDSNIGFNEIEDWFKNIRIFVIDKENNEIEAKRFDSNIGKTTSGAYFNLTLQMGDNINTSKVYSSLKIINGEKYRNFHIGHYEVYCSKLSDIDSLIVSYSPLGTTSKVGLGDTFVLDYEVSVNPNRYFDSIEFSLTLPEGYSDIAIEDISWQYSEDKTNEYVNSKIPTNEKVYVIKVKCRKMVHENLQFQPIITAKIGDIELKTKPIGPFSIIND